MHTAEFHRYLHTCHGLTKSPLLMPCDSFGVNEITTISGRQHFGEQLEGESGGQIQVLTCSYNRKALLQDTFNN